MFLIIGDPHFTTNNIQEIDNFIKKLHKLIKREKPDIIVVLGDVLHEHERLHTQAMNKAQEFIKFLSEMAEVYCLVGNHDLINNRQFLTQNHWMNAMKMWDRVTIIDQPQRLIRNDIQYSFVPYVPPGSFMDALDFIKDWKKSDIIFAHQEIRGCKMGAIVSEEGDEWCPEYPFLVSGHIHSHQWVGDNVYYPGSCMQHAFGESEKNIIATMPFTLAKQHIKEYDLGLPRKRIVYIDMEDIKSYDVPDTKDKIKLTVTGNQHEFKSFKKTKKYKELMTSGVKIVYKYKKDDDFDDMKHKHTPDNFMTILDELVANCDNEHVQEDYKKLLKNNL